MKGRGNTDAMEQDASERYSGKGSIFSRLDTHKDGPVKSVEGWIVFIRNLHEEATEEDIMDKFAAFGAVKNLQMPLDRRTGYVKGFALVEYDEKDQAEKAIKQMNGAKFYEKELNVDWAFFSEGK
eukprot:TRINITY_DN323_c0_g1_i3.p2 TRINITY_DN323_c0_g1~~TRINITY_DN323_c0_g1_i3.p2  ORF type:complete len:125 (-),score=25.60 TRINITY_DN323_c0_g1_i3:42-416(-)